MNKERFHNAFALTLVYKQFLNDERFKIIVVDNVDGQMVVIEDTKEMLFSNSKFSVQKG